MAATKKITYSATRARTMQDLQATFRQWGVGHWEISSPVMGRGEWEKRGLPPAGRRVTLEYAHPRTGQRVVLSVDAQETAKDNLRVLYLAVEQLRLNEVRGLADTIESAYLQLAAPASARDPYEVLGIRPDAPMEAVEAVYRALAKTAHPDRHGGDDAAMVELNAAIERVRADKRP